MARVLQMKGAKMPQSGMNAYPVLAGYPAGTPDRFNKSRRAEGYGCVRRGLCGGGLRLMKQVKLFHFEACPYCRETMRWLDEVKGEHPELAAIPVEKVDERLEPWKIKGYDYWYVPTFFVDDKKVHEGVCSREIVERVLRGALE